MIFDVRIHSSSKFLHLDIFIIPLGIGSSANHLARALMPHASLSVIDEGYDITSSVTSSVFEVPEVFATSSTRDGKTSVFYGLQRLSEVREGMTEAFLHDGRGSVVQTILGSSVASWHRYGAFGKVTAGSDTHERTFFGYDSEEQDPLTGLLYLRARYYDTSSARFGVADTYLGNTFDPITQNRYLYCASDPVNHADPTGHYTQRDLLNWGLSRGGRAASAAQAYLLRYTKPKPKVHTSWPSNRSSFYDPNAKPGQAPLGDWDRANNQLQTTVRLKSHVTEADAWATTMQWIAEATARISSKYGVEASQTFLARQAVIYWERFVAYYCGNASNMQDWTYDRKAAIKYVRSLTAGRPNFDDLEDEFMYALNNPGFRNPSYGSFKGNCANFVSQVLHEGGIPMNEDWHSYPNLLVQFLGSSLGPLCYLLLRDKPSIFWDTTLAWTRASTQFSYFSDPTNGYINGDVIDISKGLYNSGEGETNVSYSDLSSQLPSLGIQAGDIMYFYNQEEGVHHAAVISKVEDGEIYYSANSVIRDDQPLVNGLEENDGVVIVRLR